MRLAARLVDLTSVIEIHTTPPYHAQWKKIQHLGIVKYTKYTHLCRVHRRRFVTVVSAKP